MKSLVVGGAGTLGRAFVRDLKKKGFNPICVDFYPNPEASENILMKRNVPIKEQSSSVAFLVSQALARGGSPLSAVFCSAGGWAGGEIGSLNFLETINHMNSVNLESAALAAHLSVNHLAPSGMLVLTGAEAALKPAPSMAAYGISKVGTHYLLQCVASDPKFVANKNVAMAVLPVTIDSDTNRTVMPDADFTTWTKPEDIAKKCMEYLTEDSKRPVSGSLMSVHTKAGISTWSAGTAICSAGNV